MADANYDYTYDNEGNRLSRTDRVSGDKEDYTWDRRNRLAEIVFSQKTGGTWSPVKMVRNTYDAFDRLVKQETDSSPSGGAFGFTAARTEYFGYDGQDLLFDILDSDGAATNQSPSIKHRYLHGPAVDQVLAQENLSVADVNSVDRTYWMLTDHQGSVRELVRKDGTIAAHYQYDSFGKLLDGLENVTRFGYAGYERDTATGYYKTDARWYDPQSGKWISEDPIGFGGGDANLSRYVHNSPTNWVDPEGRAEFFPWTFAREWYRATQLDRQIRDVRTEAWHRNGQDPQEFDRLRRIGLDTAKAEMTFFAEFAYEFEGAGFSGGMGVCRLPSSSPMRRAATTRIAGSGTAETMGSLLGHYEYTVRDRKRADAFIKSLLEFRKQHAPKATIQYVTDVAGGRINTVTGNIRINKDYLKPEWSHLHDGLLAEELVHFKQLVDEGKFGKRISKNTNRRLEDCAVKELTDNGFEIFDPGSK